MRQHTTRRKIIVWMSIFAVAGFILTAFAPLASAAITRITLTNDNPREIDPDWSAWFGTDYDIGKFFAYGHYTGIAIFASQKLGDDIDIEVYADVTLNTKLAASYRPAGKIDAVIVYDSPPVFEKAYFAKIIPFEGISAITSVKYYVEGDSHSGGGPLYGSDPDPSPAPILYVGKLRASRFEIGADGSGRPLLNVYSVYLHAGARYNITLSGIGVANYNITLYLMKGTGTLSEALVSGQYRTAPTPAVTNPIINFQPPETGWYGVVVVNGPTNTDPNSAPSIPQNYNYNILVSGEFEMSTDPITQSQLIAPGMWANYTLTLDSDGVTARDYAGNWQPAAPGATDYNVSIYANRVDAIGSDTTLALPAGMTLSVIPNKIAFQTGVSTNTTLFRVQTTTATPDGTYYFRIFANDLSAGPASRKLYFTLTVSTVPDFFVTALPNRKAVAPGSSVRFMFKIDTINNFQWPILFDTRNNGTLLSSSYIQATFYNPNPVVTSPSIRTYYTNLTVNTSVGAKTPDGSYLIEVVASNRSSWAKPWNTPPVRWANVTLAVVPPVNVTISNPQNGDIIGGIYTFKVSAVTTPPNTVTKVELTFGGVMSGVTRTMYYDAADGLWKVDVNTNAFPDGVATVNATATDSYGGQTTKGPVSFTIMNTAPSPMILTPRDKMYVGGNLPPGPVIPIRVNVSGSASGSIMSVQFKIDNNAYLAMVYVSGDTWEAPGGWDSRTTTDGAHTLTVRAKNKAGYIGESSVTIYVDNNPPSASVSVPIADTYIGGLYTFRIFASDTVAVDHVNITVPGIGMNIPTAYNTQTGFYEYTVGTNAFADGTYYINATVWDKVNLRSTSATVRFYIDNTPPSIMVRNVSDNMILGGLYNISVEANDLFLNRVEYKIDTKPWLLMSGRRPNYYTLWDTTAEFDGMHTLSFRAIDNITYETSLMLRVYVDNRRPTCSIASPTQNSFADTVHIFRVAASDIVGIDRVTVSVFGVNTTASYNSATGFYEYIVSTLAQPDGWHNVTATAFDRYGRTNVSRVAFKVDNTPPAIVFRYPKNGDYVSGNFTLNIAVTDLFLLSSEYNIDGAGWVTLSVPWNTTSERDGAHNLTIRGIDQVGHTSTQTIIVYVDNNPPTLNLIAPATAGEFVKGPQPYTFRVSAADNVSIDYVELTLIGPGLNTKVRMSLGASGYYEYTTDVTLWTEGWYNVSAVAVDKSGKRNAMGPRAFRVDNHAPVLTLNYPLDKQYVQGVVRINATMNDTFPWKIEYNVDNTGWYDISVPWNTTALTEREYSIEIKAYDLAGFTTSLIIKVTVDNNLPAINILAPAAVGEFVKGPNPYVFRVSATDNVSVDYVELTLIGPGLNTTVRMSLGASGYYEYTTDVTLWTEGWYNVSAVAVDKSGKRNAMGPRAFRVDNHAPVLTLISPIDLQYVEGIVQINAGMIDTFPWKIEYNVDNTGWYDVSVLWNTTAIPDARHNIEIKAYDLAGFTTSLTIRVVVDNTCPNATIVAPAHGDYIEQTYTIRVSASDFSFGVAGIDYVILTFGNASRYQTMRMVYSAPYFEWTTDTTTKTDGVYYIEVQAYDLSGKCSSRVNATFYIDNHPPVVSINSPLPNSFVEKLVLINTTVTDRFLYSVEYDIDGTGWVPITQLWNTTKLSDGRHRITVRALDYIPTHLTVQTIEVTVDNTPPMVKIQSPQQDMVVKREITIDIVATDIVGIDIVNITITGTPDIMRYASFNTITRSYYVTFDTTFWVEDTSHIIIATAVDLSGKKNVSVPIKIHVDNEPPILIVHSPQTGDYVSGVVDFNVTVIEEFELPTEYNVDDTGWVWIRRAWDTTRLSDGVHRVSIRARSQAGHETIQTVVVTVDNTPPRVSISAPVNLEYIGGLYTLKISAEDVVGISRVKIQLGNDTLFAARNLQSGFYELTLSTMLYPDGVYNLSASATDLSNKTTSTGNITFQIDNTPPALMVLYPKHMMLVYGNIRFNLSASDRFLKTMEYNVDGSGWVNAATVLNTTALPDGTHTVVLRATDYIGHTSSETITIITDNTRPKVTVDYPDTDGIFVNKDIVVEIFATDNIGLSAVFLDIDGTGKRELTPVAGNIYQYRLDTTRFNDGEHMITVSAVDSAGHRAVVVRKVNFDNTGPEINILGPVGVVQGQVTFEVSVMDRSQRISKVQINIDSTGWREMIRIGNTSTYTYIWFTTEQMNGPHIFEVRAYDALGNEAVRQGNVQVGNPVEVQRPSIVEEFKSVLPIVWFVLVLVIFFVFLFMFRRRLRRWLREDKRREAEEKAWREEEKRRRGLQRYLMYPPPPPPPPPKTS